MKTGIKISEKIKKDWGKYSPEVLKTNDDGVFVVMDDLDERYLFYIFENPLNKKLQVNEIEGFRKRWDSVNEFIK